MTARTELLLSLSTCLLLAGLAAPAARPAATTEGTHVGEPISEDLDLPLVLAIGDRIVFGLRTGAPLPHGVAAGGEDQHIPAPVRDLRLELTVERQDTEGNSHLRLALGRRTGGAAGEAGSVDDEGRVASNELVHEAVVDAHGRISSLKRVGPIPAGELDLPRDQVRLWLEHLLGTGLHGRTIEVDEVVSIGGASSPLAVEAGAPAGLPAGRKGLAAAVLAYEGSFQPADEVIARFLVLLPLEGAALPEEPDPDGAPPDGDEQGGERMRAVGLAHYDTSDGLLVRLRFRADPAGSGSEDGEGAADALDPEEFLRSIQGSDIGGGPWITMHRLDAR